MKLSKIKGEKRNHLLRCLYTRCRQLSAPLAVVGTGPSAELLMEVIQKSSLPFLGIYDQAHHKKADEILGQPVRPFEDLAKLPGEAVVVIGSSAESTLLLDTIQRIGAFTSCKTLTLKSLLDLFFLKTELKKPLDYKFDDYIFGRAVLPVGTESQYWHHLPEASGIDFTGKTVLELGPCEGHDTVSLMARKPKKLIALEARPVNYAKIAVSRALHNWQNHELILGDMHLFPQLVKEKLDIIICMGVFYHSDKPWWLLQSCMEHADTILLGGHVATEHSRHYRTFTEVKLESGTYTFEVYPECDDPLAGMINHSLWFFEKDLERFFNYHGFEYQKYAEGMVDPTGWWIDAVVRRKKPRR